MFVSPTSTTWQASIGLVAGSVYGAASAWLLLRAPFFAGARDLLAKIFRTAPVGLADLVWISVAAGIGEEMLFRGAIQPWIGIGWATAIFTLAHAWVPVRGAALAVYVVFVTVAGAGLGLLFAQAGLVAAIVAHAGIDFVVLLVAWRALGAGR
jgi:membrane protease YdiL (CAAX protease family)